MIPLSPYERRKGESARAHAVLLIYLDLGSDRSLRACVQAVNKTAEKKLLLGTVGRWSKRWDWPARARERDNEVAAVRRAEAAKHAAAEEAEWAEMRKKRRRQRYQNGQKAIEVFENMLKYPLAEVKHDGEECMTPDGKRVRAVTIIKPVKWSMQSAARLALLGDELIEKALNNAGAEGGDKYLADEEMNFVDFKPRGGKEEGE